jgi:hypothetical protein
MIPPPSIHQSSRHNAPPSRSSSMSLRPHHAFPSLPLPPPPNTVNPRVRPRTGSMDAVNAPAVKRSRGDSDRRSRSERAMFNESVRLILPSLLYFLTFCPFDLSLFRSRPHTFHPSLVRSTFVTRLQAKKLTKFLVSSNPQLLSPNSSIPSILLRLQHLPSSSRIKASLCRPV